MAAPTLTRHISRPRHYVCSACLRKQSLLAPTKRAVSFAKQDQAKYAWDAKAEEIKAGKQKSMLSILEERGFVNSIAGDRDSLDKLMTEKRIGAYVGIDPTAPSMHVGHLLPLMALFWLYVHGFRAVSLMGGATCAIGDPTGRTTSREVQDSMTRRANINGIYMQLKRLWGNVHANAKGWGYDLAWTRAHELMNNNTWMERLPFMEVLKVLGPGVRLGAMLSRDTVKNKMEKGDGMSFAEFSYPLLQAWDWWHLYNKKKVQVQIGGSDQYGNIVAGIDAIKYIAKTHTNPDFRWPDKEDPSLIPYGLTVPLLTTASGQKFGKSAGNAIWLDKDMTSVFELYQFFVRTADADVERYLKLFTLLPLDRIRTIMDEHHLAPERRSAQHVLAQEFVELVHGKDEARQASVQHRMLFGKATGRVTQPSTEQELSNEILKPGDSKISGATNSIHAFEAPKPSVTLPRSLVVGQPTAKVLWSAGLVKSRSEGGRLIISGGAYIGTRPDKVGLKANELVWTNATKTGGQLRKSFLIEDSLLVLRAGKWNLKVVKVVSDEDFEALELDAPGWQALKEQREPQPAEEA
ncbi:tyrosyl-tRNA synthetase [Coniosporium apollinis]|uniref:Tyrosine--tRNA ligase n=1 Tax=Coniosporium apollinis TaxID=61459 RepID=A0ABQ9NRT3_9PEZI|nr:tyrosyl-tRNA synthetase [Coniosporium apollinis]